MTTDTDSAAENAMRVTETRTDREPEPVSDANSPDASPSRSGGGEPA